MTTTDKPSEHVLQAIGTNMPLQPLSSEQGQNYWSGNLGFKLAQDDAETTWIAAFYLYSMGGMFSDRFGRIGRWFARYKRDAAKCF
ncbi:MAG: hypothetical protein ACPG8W_08165 [Candidatus Promineifilaceae bacterium]